MSLFDVIRYPIRDFVNKDEISSIPTDIVHPWAVDCLSYLDFDDAEKVEEYSSYYTALVVYKYILVSSKQKYDTLDEKYIGICKYYFLTMLKARIRDA